MPDMVHIMSFVQQSVNPMMHACNDFTKFAFTRDDDTAILLFERGAEIQNDKYSALFQSILGQRIHIMEFLLAQGADTEQVVEVRSVTFIA